MDIISAVIAAETAAESSSPVAAVAQSFGLNVKLFLAQLLNFGLLVFILWRLLYKPLINFMEERSKKIAAGLKDAALYQEKLALLETERQNVLTKADVRAGEVLMQASAEGEEIKRQAKAEAEKTAALVVEKAKEEAKREKDAVMVEVEAAASDLVVLAAEKVLRHKLDATADKRLIDEALKELK